MSRAAAMFTALLAAPVFAQSIPDPAATIAKIRASAQTYMRELALLTCTEDTRQTLRVADVTSTERREDGCDTTNYRLFAVQAPGLTGDLKFRGASSDWQERLPSASLRTATGFLAALAEPHVDPGLQWLAMTTLSGRSTALVSFRVPASQGYPLVDTVRTIRVPCKGLLYANPESGAFARVELRCTDIPRDSAYDGADVAVDFKPFTLDGRPVDLPSHSVVRFRMKRADATNEAEYSAYRIASFASSAEIRFGDAVEEEQEGRQ